MFVSTCCAALSATAPGTIEPTDRAVNCTLQIVCRAGGGTAGYRADMSVAERIRASGADLTTAERRVAEVIVESPQSVAFGTVADLARRADVGAASVVRLANKLGFDG